MSQRDLGAEQTRKSGPQTVTEPGRDSHATDVAPRFSAAVLEALFNSGPGLSWNTRLVGGAREPLYTPAAEGRPACIYYTRDYFRSALHEVAHWCIAGRARRQREDYGYWYAPDGRSAKQQTLFLRVEEKPQALELLFCAACGHDFFVSTDNLGGVDGDRAAFERAVFNRASGWLKTGTPPRAHLWLDVLAGHYAAGQRPDVDTLNRVFRVFSSSS